MSVINSLLTNPSIYNITQSAGAQVGVETGLKAIGRPGFILLDNNIDPQTKKYSAMKEFLFQLTCLVVSLGVVIPVFKKGSFKIARKLFKDEAVFKAFDNPKNFYDYKKLSNEDKKSKLSEINKSLKTNFKIDDINEDLGKGTIETSSILGSVIGLSALSPIISRPFVRPVLKALGINNDAPQKNSQEKLDVKA